MYTVLIYTEQLQCTRIAGGTMALMRGNTVAAPGMRHIGIAAFILVPPRLRKSPTVYVVQVQTRVISYSTTRTPSATPQPPTPY